MCMNSGRRWEPLEADDHAPVRLKLEMDDAMDANFKPKDLRQLRLGAKKHFITVMFMPEIWLA
jgi:hypothetical protein